MANPAPAYKIIMKSPKEKLSPVETKIFLAALNFERAACVKEKRRFLIGKVVRELKNKLPLRTWDDIGKKLLKMDKMIYR